MNRVAQMPAAERAEMFAETAARKDLPEAVVEKDFWVCWVLQQLFSIDSLSGRLLFKGGTSLSKIFHAINRFSEDIDLAVDYVALGFTGKRDPKQADISKTKRAKILAEMMTACQQYIASDFPNAFRTHCLEVLGEASAWNVAVSKQDANVVRFQYPAATVQGVSYVTPQVVLELGTHAEFVPRARFTIKPFVAEEFPRLVLNADAAVEAILAKRTFWEKVTILHAEHYRPADKLFPGRYSRHYYDTAMLAQSPVKAEALADMELLAQVVRHKEAFYPSAWARYELARPGSIRLLQAEDRLASLRQDYRQMAVMIFGEPPAFDDVIQTLTALEREINQ
jgi:hypothetical protein